MLCRIVDALFGEIQGGSINASSGEAGMLQGSEGLSMLMSRKYLRHFCPLQCLQSCSASAPSAPVQKGLMLL